MAATRKFWLLLAILGLGLAGIACSLGPVITQSTPTPNPTVEVPTQTSAPDLSGLVGYWLDPDTTGTVTTIVAVEGGYVVQSVMNPDRGGNEVTQTSWDGATLSWTYCASKGACVTSRTTSLDGDTLNTSWTNDQGQSGYTALTRTDNNGASTQPMPGLVGQWLDPDTNGTYHVIVWQNGQYVVTETRNPNRGGNEVTSSSWDGTTLTWTYCVNSGACVTTETVELSGDSLYTNWSNDAGISGSTILQRVP